MNPIRDEIFRLVIYYQRFHHTLIGWYLTISSFMIGGLLAANTEAVCALRSARIMISATIVVIAAYFILTICFYGARIGLLWKYLSGPPGDIPNNWIVAHRHAGLKVSGFGSVLFIVLVGVFAATSLALVWFRLF